MADSNTKFASINLRKSYGQQQSLSHSNHQPFNANYGQAARGRPGSAGGTGGGMVVLSRSKTSQKASGPKLSVPPPLNLPSLRKEHERFDVSGSGGGTGSGAGPSRPTSSGVGWSKPGPVALQGKDGSVHGNLVEPIVDSDNNGNHGSHLPSSARPDAPVGHASGSARTFLSSVEKASVLRGEDFPSLHAALPVSSGTGQKQKDGLAQKQRQAVGEDSSLVNRDGSRTSALVDMHSQAQSRQTVRNGMIDSSTETHGLVKSPVYDQSRKPKEYFPGPLPLVLNPRSDWADDERDTGHGLPERGRDIGFPKGDDYWDRDFDLPRASVLPSKPVYKQYERRGIQDNVSEKGFSSAVLKVDNESRNLRTPSREGRENNNWRSTSFLKDQNVASDRNGTVSARGSGFYKDAWNTRYTPSHAGDVDGYSGIGGNKDSTFGQKERYSMSKPFSGRVSEHNASDRYSIEQSSRYRSDPLLNTTKSSFTSGGKMAYIPDRIQGKSSFSKSERVVEDSFHKEFGSSAFDDMDPFYGGWPGVIKRKKDTKPTDFVDPVRESFEAELERVQRMQELERQRLVDEQERATKEARKEEEERQRLIREEEERQRRLEEEAREAAWREDQERLESIQKAEEQRTAREEEKKRIFMEEERRKQAALQKLLELEAKMAKRETGSSKADSAIGSATVDEKLPSLDMEKDNSSTSGFDNWEENERMVERITNLASIESSSSSNRDYEMNMKPYFGREDSSSIPDRGKSINPWRRDVFGDGSGSSSLQEQEMAHFSPRGDTFVGGRVVPRKEFYGGARPRGYVRRDMQENYMEEFGHQRDQRWNFPGDSDIYHKKPQLDYEFSDNLSEKCGDGWGQGRYRGNHLHLYPNDESDELYSYGRSRYAMRQPRVLPPPSLASAHRVPFGGLVENPNSSTYLENSHYHHTEKSESSRPMGYYSSYEDGFETSDPLGPRQENPASENLRRNEEVTPRSDSQSSLSVTSPPNSSPHLSHDELDESGCSPVISPKVHEGDVLIIGNKSSDTTIAIDDVVNASSCASAEADNWTVENHDMSLQQEEYDEHEDDYEEEYEVHEGEDENLDINEEFEDLHLEERESSDTVDNLVLGFDDGVQVQLSSVDFQKDLRREERDFAVPDASRHTVDDQVSLTPVQDDVQILHPMVGSQITIDSPSGTTVHGSDKAKPEPIEPTTVASDLPTNIDVFGNYGLSARQTASPATLAIGPTQLATPSTSSQADLPVRLQFGLFSGPSLIPSLVPAIQIGSIQMPLHPPVGPSFTSHIHPPQCPIFQFGQLTYASPFPMASKSIPCLRPNVQAHSAQPAQDTTSQTAMQEEVKSHSKFDSGSLHQSRDSFLVNNFEKDDAPIKTLDAEIPQVAGDKISLELTSKGEHEGQIGEPIQPPNQFTSGAKRFGGVRNLGIPTNNRGRRYAYAIKNSNMSTNFPANAAPQDSRGYHRRPRRFVQRTEFRVRDNGDERHYSGNVSNNNSLDEKLNYNGRNHGVFERSVSRQGNKHRKPFKRGDESDNLVSDNSTFQGTNAGNKKNIENGNYVSTRAAIPSHSMDENLKRNISEEDFGAPLQSGVVQVFNQPGIEARSDEDDFIEVRSKRQMLNDRREQRQKEIKAKYPVSKQPPKKPRAPRQSIAVSKSVQKASVSVYAATPKRLDVVPSEGHGKLNMEVTPGTVRVTSQPLPPIGAPAKSCEHQTVMKSQTNEPTHTDISSIVSPGGSNLVSSSISETKNKLVDDVPSSITSWGATQITQQVMSLTQTQLEEAMRPVCFDSHIPSIGGQNSTMAEATPSASILTKDKSFSSSVSPINSLLAGEKIQFGAVTSATILPLTSHPASHGIRVPGSTTTDMQILQKSSATESGIFFESDKNTNSCIVHDCEAEAEAAASAVAVAAIGGDETVGSRIGSVCASDAKDFGGDVSENSAVMPGDQKLSNQARGEDSLTVSLPADLSVETPAISMWPTLPSPQNSTSPLLSHFPGPPSHFPFYEMNPMLGRPVFSLQHETSTDNQSQSQAHTPSISGPFSSWQPSAVDSFYGPPAGYPGPFISPPGGISGVQGPHHMVVYNHFAPAGQFGQVGLSFMGATYIPTGKQPDWKHNPTSSAMGIGEEDINSINMASSQHRNSNLASTNQHLSTGSPLMPVASPLTMFDVSQFQPSEASTQTHWSNVPAPPLNSISVSRGLHQQADGILPSQFGHGLPAEQSLNANNFLDTETSVSRSHPNFSTAEGANVTQFADQLGLVDSSLPSATGTSSQSSSRYTALDADKSDGTRNVAAGNNKGTFRSQSSLQHRNASGQQGYSAGYNYQRGAGMSQRNTSGSEWNNRRTGNNSRHQSQGSEKGFSAPKVKQIYVAKQTMGGAPSAG